MPIYMKFDGVQGDVTAASPEPHLAYELKDTLITSYSVSGSGADASGPEREIQVESWSWGDSSARSGFTGGTHVAVGDVDAASGGGAGKVSFQDIHFTTELARSTAEDGMDLLVAGPTEFDAGSHHSAGVNVCMADGSVRFVSQSTDFVL